MKIGWIGVHEEGRLALEAVCEAGYTVTGLMTLEQNRAERRCGSGSYEQICSTHNVPIFPVAHVNDEDSLEILRRMQCDLLVVLGWGQILSDAALQIPTVGTVGAHASLLPHNRGSAPVNWAIIKGETSTGNSLMWLAPGVDTGALIAQRAFPITPFDTCDTIYDLVGQSNRDMVLDLLKQLTAGHRPGRPQAHTDERVLPRRRPQDGRIDWDDSAQQIYNLIRAVTRPYPGAFARLGDQTWKIWQAALLPVAAGTHSPGTILGPVCSPDPAACGIVVATGQGCLLVLEVEDDNGRVLSGPALCEHPFAPAAVRLAA